jgi:hypothetical protein
MSSTGRGVANDTSKKEPKRQRHHGDFRVKNLLMNVKAGIAK